MIALCKLVGDRIKSNRNLILGDAIGVLSGGMARDSLLRIMGNKWNFLYGTEGVGNDVGNGNSNIAAAPA